MGVRLLSAIAVCAVFAAPAALGQTSDTAADAFRRAERIIKGHRLLTPKAQRCSKLVLRNGNNDRVAKVGVYENHNSVCGGDPDIEHRLFDLEIDMKTGAAKWDNNMPDMEMRPVPRRRR